MHAEMFTSVTWTFTSESAFRFRKLFINALPIEVDLYIWHTHALGQDPSMHAKLFIPVTLTLTSESMLRF